MVEREGAAVAGCALLLLLLVAHLDPGIDLAGAAATLPALRLLLLNAMPALAAFALLLAASRRLLLSTWLTLLALVALYGANAAKLGALQMPLLPADLRFLAEPGPAARLFVHYLDVDALHALLGAGAIATTLALCREPRLRGLAGWRRAATGGAALALGASLMAGAAPWRFVYDAAAQGFQPWALDRSAASTGLIGGLLVYHWELGGGDVPPADRAAATAFLHAHAPALRAGFAAATTNGTLPDIVVVQSESLFDPARLRDVLSGRFLRAYHRLARHATAGELAVPTFAGGTIRTEFEVLTGAPLASLGGVQYPWLELERESYPGLARVLDAHGYRSVAVHPNASAFWNRAQAYAALGFGRFVDAAAFPPDRVVGLFTSDAALTDRVLGELADDGPPQFVFAISMENHGPFDWRPGLDPQRLAALPMPEQLDAGARHWLGNYLYLLDDADHELARLADTLARRKRRTLLLFYGDHLPDLGPVYAALGFDDGRDAKHQPVPWLLIDNDDALRHRLDTRAWMLPGLLLQAAGIHDGAWFDLLAALARSPDFDPDSADDAAGVAALARLQLRGELEPLLADALGLATGD
ncbi:MAG TPA: LTA synthase family protein [Dokdonella sp.]|nr:LTA synthase family protein [Dokdonella sp.]